MATDLLAEIVSRLDECVTRENVMDVESSNHGQIEMLNQRGGRMLSVVDLVRAGTIGVEMAAYAMRGMAEGASLLTGARPGGAGKTTVMAALLNFLPVGVRIVTVDSADVIAEARGGGEGGEGECYLVHEIGAGRWYGYLWGPRVGQYVSLIGPGRAIASCLHADTLAELTAILCSAELGVRRDALGRVGLILFMHVDRGRGGYRRRVSTLYEADGCGGHRLVYEWDPAADTFRQVGDLRDPDELGGYADFVHRLIDAGQAEQTAVRRGVVAFYRGRLRAGRNSE